MSGKNSEIPPDGVSIGMPGRRVPEGITVIPPSNYERQQERWSEIRKGLSAFFAPNELEWRLQSSGFKGDRPWAMALAYVNNRAIEYRLDRVCGIGGWKNDFRELHGGGFLCGIGITVDGVDWVWKWDGADQTQVEATKGGISSAMKRAGQQWDIGRYLYYFPVSFAEIYVAGSESRPDGWNTAFVKMNKNDRSGIKCYWKTPEVPSWAMPEVKSDEIEIVY